MTPGNRIFLCRKLIFLTFVAFCFLQGSFASQSIPSINVDHHQEYRFLPGATRNNDLAVNDLLQVLAEGNGKLRVFTGYDFQCNITLDFAQTEKGNHNVLLTISNPAILGDKHYKDFPLDKHLYPPLADIKLLVTGRDSTVLNELNLSDVSWQDKAFPISIHSFRLDKSNGNNTLVTVKVASVKFHYGEEYNEQVALLSNSLASYYAAHTSLEEITVVLQDLDARDYENTILNEFVLCEAEVIMGQLQHAPFLRELPLDEIDPESIIPRMATVEKQIDSLRNAFNHIISNIDKHLYSKGKELLAGGDTLKASEYFNRVLVYNPLHIPSHIAQGTLELEKGAYNAVMNRFAKILGPVGLPSQWTTQAHEFSAQIYSHRTLDASEAMQDGRFLDALYILTQLEEFCMSLQQWSCPAALSDSIASGHYGMYRSYLSVAQRAYQTANYSFAVSYIESAQKYSRENQQYIPDDSEAVALLQQVVEGYYRQAENAMLGYDFATALVLLEAVEKICIGQPNINCRDDVALLIEKAKEGEMNAAKATIPIASEEPGIMQPEMTVKEAIERVKDLLSKGHLSAWAGETAAAREQLGQIMQYTLRYGLRSDSLINARIISLEEMIYESECRNTYQEVTSLIHTMRDYFNKEYYSEAALLYSRAQELAEASQQCQPNAIDTLGSYNYIALAAVYQDLLHEARSAYYRTSREGFEEFIEKHTQAGRYFHKNKLGNLGMHHQDLFEFTLQASNTSLVKAVIYYLSDQGEPDKVLALLDLLRTEGFASRELKELQEYAGQRAAKYIYTSTPHINPEIYLQEKTGNDPWFRNYSRSFQRNWPG